jgi:beta-phosphoglucomutase-like phosphatase (HAD superfamily)
MHPFIRNAILAVLSLVSVSTCLATGSMSAAASCDRGWVFFDLGKTLIDTHDWDHLKYLPGALDYLHSIQAAGFHMGAITNIPEAWGSTEAEKLATLKNEINRPWTEPAPFEWQLFETILVPLADVERKPAPVLFLKAIQKLQPCQLVYQSGDQKEVDAALAAGFTQAYVTGKPPRQPFMPIETILPGNFVQFP